MTATKQTPNPDFRPGTSYQRDDGTIMVEVRPGEYANSNIAAGLGILPATKGTDHGKAKS